MWVFGRQSSFQSTVCRYLVNNQHHFCAIVVLNGKINIEVIAIDTTFASWTVAVDCEIKADYVIGHLVSSRSFWCENFLRPRRINRPRRN